MTDIDQVDEETMRRLDVLNRSRHPDMIDGHGQLRRHVLIRAVRRRFGGLRLSRDQVAEVIRMGHAATAQRSSPLGDKLDR
jgi:hypothetical protein